MRVRPLRHRNRPCLPAERFWQRVDKSGDCWTWLGGASGSGYGSFAMNKKNVLAHRAAWILTHGPINDDLCALHRCDNRKCVNPSHLFLGTRTDNAADRDAKGRNVPPRGERNPRAKIRVGDVVAIRARRAAGELCRSIADEYGLDESTVAGICRRRIWRHVP